jgi:RNase P/RNase MRP subunit p30
MERIILNETNFNRLKELVKKNKEKEIVFSSTDDDLNRKVMEKLDIQIILIPLEERKDYMKQRNSGFNQVMAKIAKKKNISLGIDFKEIINAKNKERVLARLKQNIFLCNKNRIQIKFLNCPDKKSCKSLGLVLGMPTWMFKKLN